MKCENCGAKIKNGRLIVLNAEWNYLTPNTNP